ncbi:BREX system P-loop protein BrxC [Clostridium formicaceticum]|uniref:ATPase n=1 Tax=Clostridium formicaceticum TaxID=1497 RepID=A0AAC9WIC8_9CLOT|nr:BREX system P-loop protein BrxC [Clostridium formicaceticum]AOY75381.1 hypothetical protein BJL90_05380 [Clostridium formicaceticum]ARE89836.1 hypothetical protein CLFO_43190 [Clostridium formicaceticum]
MQLRKMFYKEIDRDIKGVIKIGQEDDTNVYQELEEYVVTRELSKHFSEFFEAYKKGINNYTDKMGVWISGFFGSGKSHFLKILSYLLENKEVKGKKAISYFDDKLEDSMVLADIKMAGDTSADVVLFNIDSKSDSNSKTNKDAIVKVFMKVFNEIQGFCAALPWVAELERQLVKDGTYEAFKSKFEELSGNKWTDAREDFYFEEDNIVKALAATTKMSEDAARSWYNKAEESYSLSIEKFANRVKEYIESKGNNHHVIFLVDEIGQYIGDDVGLMLNLQTVVEDLGTYCGGRAWVIVTSQQDIDSITKVKGNDFSKIQGRFNTRLNLSSANVDEVIKRRILRKSDVAKDTLKLLYQDKEAILKNLITFSADTAEMKTYKSEEDFVAVYPFIPYQFNLLQSVFTGIRLHGASGKHLSEGERSLLSAFQESAIIYADKEAGALIPFATFYETVEAFLDSNIRTVIIRAEDNDRLTKEDVEVLKVLFMIKYVKEIPSNIENIATLMVSHIDDDKIELKKQIEESLKRLLKETLIQKNGNEYIFLTHEEQDVNKEIQNIPIDMGETILKIGEEIFEGIYNEKKYRYNARYHFDFNKIIDDRFLSPQKHDIGLKVITPYYDTGIELTDQELKMMATRENNLILKLPMDTTFLEEMEEVLKIQTYLLRKGGSASTSEIEEIKIRKSREVAERKERVKTLVVEALKSADIYANSQKLDIKSKNPIERINEGFKLLIESMYNKLNYITTFVESNKDLNDILLEDNMQVKLTDDVPNKLAVDEIDGYIERNTERNIPMTIKSITTLYGKAPYGWKDLDITGIILRLFKVQEIKLQLGNEYLTASDKDLINYLTKRDYQDRLIIKKRTKTPAKYINNVKNLAKEVFGFTAVPSDEDGLMDRFKKLCEHELNRRSTDTNDYGIYFLLEEYKNNKFYPGKEVLERGQKLFEEILKIKDTKEFYEKIYELQDELLDYEEDVFDVKKFFKNQKEQFDKAVHKLEIYEKNKTYVVDRDTIKIVEEIQGIVKSKQPYSEIHRLPNLIEEFIDKFGQLLEIECKPVRSVIESDAKRVLDELELYDFREELRSKFKTRFDNLLDRLDSANNFYEAIAMKEESDRLKIRCFDEFEKEKAKRKPKPEEKTPEVFHDDKPEVGYKVKTVKNISIANILHGVKVIETDNDIEEVVGEIRKRLKEQLNEDTKLKLI